MSEGDGRRRNVEAINKGNVKGKVRRKRVKWKN